MKYAIKVNGSYLDLYPNTVIAQTLKALDIGALASRSFNFTNRISIPKTINNDIILGRSWDIDSITNVPYTKLSATIEVSGIEIVSEGILYIQDIGKDYNVNIISGSKGFFDSISTKTLNDLTGFTKASTRNDVASYRNTTQDVLYPVVINETIDSPQVTQLSFIYYHSIIKKIFTDAGYTYSGSVFSNTKFLKKIVSAFGTTKGYVPSFVENRRASGYITTTQSFSVQNNGTSQLIQFTGTNLPGNSIAYWDTTASHYKSVDASITAGVLLYSCNVRITINITVEAGKTVNLVLRDQSGNVVDNVATNVGSGTYTYDFVEKNITNTGFLTEPPIARNGTTYGIRLAALYNSPAGASTLTCDVIVNSGSIEVTPLEIPLSVSNGTGLTSYIYYASLLPTVKQSDILKDFAVRYGILFNEKDGNVECKYIEEIVNSTPIDWTSKRDRNKNDQLQYSVGDYAQSNYFRYSNSDDTVNSDLGIGSFNIPNINIQLTTDIFTSIFDNTGSAIANNIFAAYLPTDANYFGAYPKVYGQIDGIKLLLTRSKYSLEPSVTYINSTSYSDYLVGYFEDPQQSDSMSMQQYINNHYQSYISLLQNVKKIVRYYNLSPLDIARFDFTVPIYDGGSMYLVNEIKNYVSGKVTAVELIKI